MFDLTVKDEPVIEQKAFTNSGYSQSVSFPEYLSSVGLYDLSAYAAIQLYLQAMPFFDAVDRRAQAFAAIPVRVWDTKAKEFVEDHPALELLAQPNADISQTEFLESISSFYDITGESFIIGTGQINKPPLELISETPVEFSFGALSPKFGLLNIPSQIFRGGMTTSTSGTRVFVPEETENSTLRFYNSLQNQELWVMRSFNPFKKNTFRGLPRALPVWYEIQQYVAGNRSNLSFLKRGARLSMAWINKTAGPDGELTPVQFERLQQEAQKYSGAENAGGTPILDGMEIQTFQSTNKDMEYAELQKQTLSRVFNTYRIPLALILDSTMTLNNLETAMLHFFDDSVLPHANRIYNELTRFLMPRYDNSENLVFKFDENEIPALRARMIAGAKEQNSIGVNTTDEIRDMLGDEPLPEGGDTVLVPANLIPLGTTFETEEVVEVDDEEELTGAKAFFAIMENRLDEKGNRVFSDEQIVAMALEQRLLPNAKPNTKSNN